MSPAELMRWLNPLVRRVAGIVSRGVVQTVTDTTKLQNVQVSLVADEVVDQVEHTQPYGFTAVPLPGAEALFLSVGGVRSSGVVPVVFDRSKRPTGLNPGDVALYHAAGIRVYLDNTNDMVLLGNSPTDFVALATLVKNEITTLRNAVNAFVTIFNAHVHPVPGILTGTGSTTSSHSATPATAPSTVNSVAATEVKAI